MMCFGCGEPNYMVIFCPLTTTYYCRLLCGIMVDMCAWALFITASLAFALEFFGSVINSCLVFLWPGISELSPLNCCSY